MSFGSIIQCSPLFCKGLLASGLSSLTPPLPTLGRHHMEGKPHYSLQRLPFSCVAASGQMRTLQPVLQKHVPTHRMLSPAFCLPAQLI